MATQEQQLENDNAALRAELAEKQRVLADMAQATMALQAQIEQERQKLGRIDAVKRGEAPVPFAFRADATPLADIQAAYRLLPAGVLAAALRGQLDAAVADGDMAPIVQIFQALSGADAHAENKLIKAICESATAFADSPTQYLSPDLKRQNQLALGAAIVLAFV
ncbi:hypothetical protein BDR26DRAFT_883424 [Obelidium mucronatum]|nr:hypothetical protein BDR26DRAFT_883424 [Obelidium mucronatum]